VYTMFLLAISSARKTIYITNPYFLPDNRMTFALTEASRRGVRVVILLPGAIDNNIVRHASRSQFGTLLEAGIDINEYQAALSTRRHDRRWHLGDDREHESGHALVHPQRRGQRGHLPQ